MITRYFEYAVSEGEGTLVLHGVLSKKGGRLPLTLLDHENGICESITRERYLEFITIHGSEVAI